MATLRAEGWSQQTTRIAQGREYVEGGVPGQNRTDQEAAQLRDVYRGLDFHATNILKMF